MKVKRLLWEQKIMFGVRIKNIREEQFVHPPIQYLTYVVVPWPSVLNKPVNPEVLHKLVHESITLHHHE